MKTYILDGHTPVLEQDIGAWGRWMATGNRRVKFDTATVKVAGKPVGKIDISTVFLGADHRWDGGGPPLLFETMVFGGPLDQEMGRCSTWEAAEKMHEAMCARVKAAIAEMN